MSKASERTSTDSEGSAGVLPTPVRESLDELHLAVLGGFSVLGAAVETVERRIGLALLAIQRAVGSLFTPVRNQSESLPVGDVDRHLREGIRSGSDATNAAARRTERLLAHHIPRIPAPTFTTVRFGEIPTRYLVGALGAVALLAVPVGLTAFQLSALILPVYLMVFAMSWDIVSGYTGQISLGHTVFFGLGGYTSTVLNLQHGVSPILSIPSGVVVAALGGLLIGYPALRIRGPYLSLVTLISPIILLQLVILFNNNLPYIAPSGLGGINGFVAQNDPLVGTTTAAVLTVPSFPWQVIIDYYLAVVLFFVVFAVLFLVTRANTGEILTAIRENEDAVEAVGIDTAKFKLFAFVLSGAVGGLAGAMFVHTSIGNPLNPQQILDVALAINIVMMSILGGMGTIVGAAVGAVFFVVMSFLIDSFGGVVAIPLVGETLASLMPAPLLAIALLVIVFRPTGLVPAAVRAGRWLATDPEARLDGGQ
jgi:branched-chain amino acid transport system permease protein